ncbi:MAG: helical backbone metal receptor [Methanophagales archaeon]|nr:helical backbone metal receptor [Methanophagales archaeon]
MRRSGSVNVCVLLLTGILLIAVLSLISITIACASSDVTQWNSVTEDESSNFSIDIGIGESKGVEFTVSYNLSCTWTWSVNGEEVKESEGTSSDLSYVFGEYGVYNVIAVGKGENETAECAYWNVTVSLVIEEENDVRELEGLEDYTLRISKKPERIVSMAPSCTEILFAVGAGDSVVGVTSFCNYPPEVVERVNNGEIAVIGGYSTPSLEKIVDLEPDLIVAAYGNPDDVLYSLIELGEDEEKEYPIYAQHPKNFDAIFTHIKITGAITNHEEEASSLVNELKTRLNTIEEKTELLEEEQRPRVYYAMGGLFMTTGSGTFQHDIIKTAGGENIAAGYLSSWGPFSIERIVEEDPQVIIYSSHGSESLVPEQIKSAELKTVDAVKNNRIYQIDENIMSRPGPRVVEAVEIVHRDLSGLFNIPGKGSTKINGAYFNVPFMNFEVSTKGDKNRALRCNITKIEGNEVQKKLPIGKEVDFGNNFTIKVEVEKDLEERWGISFYNVNEERWEVYEVVEDEDEGYGDEEEGDSSLYKEEKAAVKAGEERTIELDSEYLTNITIKAKEDVEVTNISLTTSKELNVSQPPAMVYRYFYITTDNFTISANLLKLNFSVNKSWIAANADNNTSAISLFYYDCINATWAELSTSEIGESDSKVYYTATKTSFGTFAICAPLKLELGQPQLPVPEVVVTPSSPSVPPQSTHTPTPKPPSPTETPETPGFEAALAVVGLLAVMYLSIEKRRKWTE